MNLLCLVGVAILGPFLALGFVLVWARRKAYRAQVPSRAYDARYDFTESSGDEQFVKVYNDGFTLPDQLHDFDTGLLELRVRTNLFGRFLDPSVELSGSSH